jgi:hypothetical protein
LENNETDSENRQKEGMFAFRKDMIVLTLFQQT